MKRRHPMQIMDHGAFRPGSEYALVRASSASDAPQGTFVSWERMFFAAALDNGEMQSAEEAISRCPAKNRGVRFTTHDVHGGIVVALWRWDNALEATWVFATMDDACRQHQIFVPAVDWATDPRIHVVDWVNPDDVCEAGLTWAEEEAKLQKRKDDAMRKALGFD